MVTEFEFELHPVDPMLTVGVSEAVTPFLGGLSLPPAPWVPEELHGATGFALLCADRVRAAYGAEK